MNKYSMNIGIEIHLELKTKTKMFSPAKNSFGNSPNVDVHPIDLGYPGTLPQVNKQAVKFGVMMAKAFKMEIDSLLRFDRKHYFYPDLPKGYQITQQKFPIGKEGYINFYQEGEIKKIELERIHLEEDTATQIHKENYSFLNFNRCGVPLLEIVSKPNITSSLEASKYVEAIQKIAISLGVSDAKMEAGSLRADLNISIKKNGAKELGTKVEIKNLNSLSNLKKAAKYEFQLQQETLEQGLKVLSWTKRFDEKSQTTINMRSKESVIDYCFMQEPNIAPIKLSNDFINEITLNELPFNRESRYIKMNLRAKTIEKLMKSHDAALFFDQIQYNNYQKTADVIFSEIVSFINKNNSSWEKIKITPKNLTFLLKKLENNSISGKQLKTIIKKNCAMVVDLKKIIANSENELISDKTILKSYIVSIIKEIKDIKYLYKKNPTKVERLIIGNLMKLTKGKANPKVAFSLISEIFRDE